MIQEHLKSTVGAYEGFTRWLSGKEFICNEEDRSSIPGSGRSLRGRNGNSLQYSCLGNPMDRGDWQVTVHGFTKESNIT